MTLLLSVVFADMWITKFLQGLTKDAPVLKNIHWVHQNLASILEVSAENVDFMETVCVSY